ncbi:MAG TPA: tetratricopeptide repeat protein [Waterburya sp.]|jgi:Flp pilus assembly protein TadD
MHSSSELLALALQHHQTGRLSEAKQLYHQVLQQEPEQVEALQLLGVIAFQNGNCDEAIAYYRQALALDPNLAPVHSNLGIVLRTQGQIEQATWHYQQAVVLQPNNAQFHFNLGFILQSQNKLEEAQDSYRQAIALQPNHAEAHHNLGCILNLQGQIEEAIACYTQVLDLKPDFVEAHVNRAEALLLLGDYNRGFAEYEWRWRRYQPEQLPHFSTPTWDGSPLEGKTILLYAEQGLGDTFQFVRYTPLLKELGGCVIVACLSSQVELLKNVPGVERVIALEDEIPEIDTQAPLMSLPYLMGTTLDTIPAPIPYIFPSRSHPLRLEAPPGTRLKVGIVWTGNLDNVHNRRRSCGLQAFLPLLETPGIEFYSLQVGQRSQDLATLPPSIRVQDLSPQLQSFTDTAAAIAQLDLVITIDTSVAHLAGALGKPTWVILPFVPDWRWLLSRCDSPWYPTMRLFRQDFPGDWTKVFSQLSQALENY